MLAASMLAAGMASLVLLLVHLPEANWKTSTKIIISMAIIKVVVDDGSRCIASLG